MSIVLRHNSDSVIDDPVLHNRELLASMATAKIKELENATKMELQLLFVKLIERKLVATDIFQENIKHLLVPAF